MLLQIRGGTNICGSHLQDLQDGRERDGAEERVPEVHRPNELQDLAELVALTDEPTPPLGERWVLRRLLL